MMNFSLKYFAVLLLLIGFLYQIDGNSEALEGNLQQLDVLLKNQKYDTNLNIRKKRSRRSKGKIDTKKVIINSDSVNEETATPPPEIPLVETQDICEDNDF